MFLSLFRLPGESQQIERIMTAFANSYRIQNENMFSCEDDSYVLAFSLIFLNSTNHNSKVPERLRLTKDIFIKTNQKLLDFVSEEYLGALYDRVVAKEFKTYSDEIEKIYERISQLNIDQSSLSQMEILKLTTNVVMTGDYFIKFGRRGSPHNRYVFLSNDQNQLCWQKKNKKGRIRYILTKDVSTLSQT